MSNDILLMPSRGQRLSLWKVGFTIAFAVGLIWPALWNGYPLVFGDTAVYVRDGVELHASWARPPFYGLFMLPLHFKITTWPVVTCQSLLCAVVILWFVLLFHPVGRGFGARLSLIAVVLGAFTSLPWFAAQLMPDFAAALFVLIMAGMAVAHDELSFTLISAITFVCTGFIVLHQSYLPTSFALALSLLLINLLWLKRSFFRRNLLAVILPPLCAVLVLTGSNFVLVGKFSPSPYGKIFLLARLIADGPGFRTLQRECPQPSWSLCDIVPMLPVTETAFLFGDNSLVLAAGGYKTVDPQVVPIISATLRAEPREVALLAMKNAIAQFVSFASGDSLLKNLDHVRKWWPVTFPSAELARFESGRQARGKVLLPDWLQDIHQTLAAASVIMLPVIIILSYRQRLPIGALALAVLSVLLVNAAVTGITSGVFDRYQSRFIWLAPLTVLCWLLGLRETGGGDRSGRDNAEPASLPGRKVGRGSAPHRRSGYRTRLARRHDVKLASRLSQC